MKKLLNWQAFAIVFILLFAAFLRLYKISDYMTFLGDEGRDVLVVYNILQGFGFLLHGNFRAAVDNLTLLGPTASVGGFFLGPIYYYFMTPFLWFFNYNPVGPAVMVALLGTVTVWLVYKIGSEFFNKTVGLISAALYTISPLAIAYSRSSWNPNPMPFFSLLTLYILYKALKKASFWLFLLCGFLLGITMQLHYLAIFLGVIMAVYIVLIRRSISKSFKDCGLIFLGFVAGWSPFLGFEARHGFPNIQSIISFIFHSGDTGGNSHFFSIIYNVFFRLFGRLVTYFPPPEQVAIGAHKNIAVWYYATLFLGIASLIAFIRLKGSSQKKLILTWFILGIGLFGFYKKPIYDYYFGFMFPLPFFFVGLLISKLGKIAGIGIFIVLVLLNLSGMPFWFPPNRQLAQVEEISRFVLNKTDNKRFNFALITGGNSDHGYRYFFKIWSKDPIVIENAKNDPYRKTVANQLLVVCETAPSCHPLGHSLWEIAGFGRAEIANEWDVSVVKVYKLVHHKGE